MSATAAAALTFATAATTLHLLSIGVAAWRCRRSSWRLQTAGFACGITLVRTIRDLGTFEPDALRSSFHLTHPDHEVIFCAASEGDAAVATVRELIAGYPHVRARLLIGDDRISANPKLNNMLKGWREARNDWIVFADSNLILPPDYLEQVLAAWRADTGAVCAPPIGSRPDGFWADVECAFLNTYQARWQYAADSFGFGFAQGKTMLFRRDVLERQGGIAALGSELAEDAATTRVVRRAGLRVRLAGPGFFQPLGRRSAAHVLTRQLRWAQLRRLTFPGWFALELSTGSLPALLAMAVAAPALGLGPLVAICGLAVVWFGAEGLLARIGGWPLSWRTPIAWLLRDLLIPLIWLRAWTANVYHWGGHKVSWRPDGSSSMTAEGTIGIR